VFAITERVRMKDMIAFDYHIKDVEYISYFTGVGHAFHQSYRLDGNPKLVQRQISHGCVNMFGNEAAIVYGFSEVGMPVWIHY
jgi:lipoprotein-anchoring transpeptidase ErfK/SrfK